MTADRNSSQVQDHVSIQNYTGGLIGPDVEWAGTVADGGTIKAETAPGCFGPMISPHFRGGHEVTQPVAVEGAEPGDAIALHIKQINVNSIATSTGVDKPRDKAYDDDPWVDHKCPECGEKWPETLIKGIGEDSIRCAECGANASSFGIEFGYSVAFDEEHSLGITVDNETATELAKQADDAMALPENSEQYPALLYHPSEIPGIIGRMKPFLGHIGTCPANTIPDAHNAGDASKYLIGANHQWGISDRETASKICTDAHMDIKEVREGSVIICPVKVKGGGVYLGDIHANQGDGELAGHTTDVSGTVELEVELIPDLGIEGPILLPVENDLPDICKPYTEKELEKGRKLGADHDVEIETEMAPVQFVGSGHTINEAVENAYDRANSALNMSIPEIRARATYTGSAKIGRLSGIAQLSLLVPMEILKRKKVGDIVEQQYNL